MDRIWSEYDRRLSGFHARDTRTLPLYVFSQREDYVRTMRENFGLNAENTSGLYFSSDRGPGLAAWVRGQSRAALYETLQHEGFHQFAHARIGVDLPPWANEGLARYFGDALLAGGKFLTGRASPGRLLHLQESIRAGRTIPFRELLSMPTEEWGNRVAAGNPQTRLQYDQAWSMVYFLIHASGGKYARHFEEYLQLVSKGFQPADAFERAFRTRDYARFEQAWKRYVLELEPDPVSTAVVRLRFLGDGLRQLHERGVAVASLDELRTRLQEARFTARYIDHGMLLTVSSDDAENFAAPRTRGGAAPAVLKLEPSGDERLPPGLVVEGLRPTVRLSWSRDAAGDLVDRIALD